MGSIRREDLKRLIDGHYEKEMVFWDGEYFYSRYHSREITIQEAINWINSFKMKWEG